MKRQLKLIGIFMLVLITGFWSCDKIKNPIEKVVNVNDTTKYVRKILLEDFSGHTCGKCPLAAEKMQELIALYGNRIVPMGVQMGWFSEPCPPHPLPSGAPSGSFATDFRTAFGNDMDKFFKIDPVGLPQGMINRKGYPSGEHLKAYSKWTTEVANLLAVPADAHIVLKNELDTVTRELDVEVNAKFLQSHNGDCKLVVVLTEDSIVDWQLNYKASPTTVSNYLHRHVMRASLNGSWGEVIATGTIPANHQVTKMFSYVIPSQWKATHCSVIAFVYDASTYEVLQAEEHKVK